MIRTRIAPSPTGQDLHIGNAYTALINYIFAKKNKGQFIVRIEDTDQLRKVEGSEERILNSLDWLGLTPDESSRIGGQYGPYRQSERKEIYKQYALELIAGNKAYYCFCTPERLKAIREKQQQEKKPPMYDGNCKKLTRNEVDKRISHGDKYVIRMSIPDSGETVFKDLVRGEVKFQNILIDDQVLLKSDGFPTYHLAVVIDDYLMKINYVIRAEEWLSSTPKHILLYNAFGWKLPEFAHTPILRNPDKSKLSKRKNPVWLSWYKEEGFLPKAINNYLLTLGWSHPEDKTIFTLTDASAKFSFDRIAKSGPIFDLTKLTWINGEYIRMMNNEELADNLYSFLNNKYDRTILLRISPLIKERIKKISDALPLVDFIFEKPHVDFKLLVGKKHTLGETKEMLKNVLINFQKISDWSNQVLHEQGQKLVNETAWKPVDLFQLIRIAISGKTVTPPLFESMEIMGKKEVLNRLQSAVELL